MKGTTAACSKVLILAVLIVCTTCAITLQDQSEGLAFGHLPKGRDASPVSLEVKSFGNPSEFSNQLIPEMMREKIREGEETRRPSRRLIVEVKAFRRFQGMARAQITYKIYVLEGQNVRHYRVVFPRGQRLFTFAISVRRIVARCISRRYLLRCIRVRPLRKQERCTDRIVESCVPPGFIVFEDASPGTRRRPRSSAFPRRSPRPRTTNAMQTPLDNADEEGEDTEDRVEELSKADDKVEEDEDADDKVEESENADDMVGELENAVATPAAEEGEGME